MAQTTMTRGAIMAEGLAQIGRTDLTSSARLWLNLFLEKAYKNQDWNWLLRRSTLTLSEGGAIPADYRGFQNANLIYQGTVQNEITQMGLDEYLAMKRGGQVSGAPRFVFVDADLGTFNFWPVPVLTYTWEIGYYYMPTLPTITDGTNDTVVPLWPLPYDILIRAIQKKGLYYNDDTRYGDEEKALMSELAEAKFNSIDKRGGASKLKLGKSYRRRF